MRGGSIRMVAGAAILALLALAGPAECQSTHSRTRSIIIENGRRLMIEGSGDIRFTDDDRGVAYMEPAGRLVIEEGRDGAPDRRVEYRGGGGGVRRRFFRDGAETVPDAADEAWIRAVLLYSIRESGYHAEQRVARIYRSGGTDAVLDEIRQIASDGARRAYYSALLRQPGLRPDDTARVLLDAGRRIASDGDKRATLAVVLERPQLRAEEMAAMLHAAAGIASDGDRSSLLRQAAERDGLADARVRDEFFSTARGIASDGDKSRVLMAVLARGGARRDAVVAAIRTARGIASDGDRSRVLMSVPQGFLRDAEVRDAFQDTMRGIASDGDRARVAIWLSGSLP